MKLVQGEVTAIDAAAKRVKLADGSTLAYDRLVVSPGVDFMTEAVGGLAAPAAQAKFLHAWKAGAQTVALRQQIEAMKDGGVFAISIPFVPRKTTIPNIQTLFKTTPKHPNSKTHGSQDF